MGGHRSRNGGCTQKRTIHSASATTVNPWMTRKDEGDIPPNASGPQTRINNTISRMARAQKLSMRSCNRLASGASEIACSTEDKWNESTQIIARVGDMPGQRTGSHGGWRSQEDLRLLVAHSAGKIPVRRADALQGRVHASECIHRATQASRASRVLGHLHPCIHQDLPHRFTLPPRCLQ